MKLGTRLKSWKYRWERRKLDGEKRRVEAEARKKKDPEIYNDWYAEHRWEFDLNEAGLREVITQETIRQAEKFDIAVPPPSDTNKWEDGIDNTRFLSREAVKELRAATRKARHETIEWRVKVWGGILAAIAIGSALVPKIYKAVVAPGQVVKPEVPGDENRHPTDPYSVVAENSLPEQTDDIFDRSPLWVTTNLAIDGKMTPIRSPISSVVYFRIVNLQSNAAVISDFSIEVMTTEGWKKVVYWTQGPLYWVGYPEPNFRTALEIRPKPGMLDLLLRGRAIGPKETVKGWLPIIYPRINALISTRIFKVTIADTLGGRVIVETGDVPAGKFTDSAFTIGERKDIAGYKPVFVQDLTKYWQSF